MAPVHLPLIAANETMFTGFLSRLLDVLPLRPFLSEVQVATAVAKLVRRRRQHEHVIRLIREVRGCKNSLTARGVCD